MIIQKAGRVGFHLLLLAIPTYFFWSALGYEPRARLVPMLVSATVIALLLVVIVGECRKAEVPESGQAEEPSLGGDALQVAIISSWALLFFFVVYLVGFLIGALVFFVFFLALSGKTSWLMAVSGAAILVGLIWGIFVKILGLELFAGILFGAATPSF
ncbi:MAG: tripartite tricarboxylate transporter TctB family protein [Candidatus Binatia bacterium]